MTRGLLAVIALMGGATAQAQVPPPPSLPGQDDLGARLVSAITAKDVAAYSRLLSDGVVVFEDGRQVARNKEEWLATYGRKLAAKGVSFSLAPGWSSTGRILFIEYFSSVASFGGDVPADCCWSHDAVAYDVGDGKVVAIRRLRGGDRTLDRHGLPSD